ncbi:ABC transporter permease subunit [Nakamurella panacisegetis]|uniref:ABC transporter permease subunit n=1 Tax=Nakamurella panacisegetis TaxID=1090615 RepID=UPI000B83876A
MLRNVTAKTLYDQRRSLLAWAVSLVLLIAMYIAIWPSIRDQPAMTDFLNNMPKAMRSLFAMSGADMSTPIGYLKVEVLSLMGPLLVLIYAITAGSASVAGEEDRHTLDLLMANPISRTRLVLDKAAAMIAGTLLLAGVIAAALLVESPLAGMTLPAGRIIAAMIHLALLAMVFGSLALAVGATTGHVVASRAVPAVTAVIAYIVNGLGPQVSWLAPFQKFSPFYQYSGHDPLINGLSWPAVLVAVGTVAVLTALGVAGFRRRDVAA